MLVHSVGVLRFWERYEFTVSLLFLFFKSYIGVSGVSETVEVSGVGGLE